MKLDVRNVGRWVKRVVIGVLVVGGVLALGSSMAEKPVEVDLARVERGPLVVTVDEDGRARVRDRYVVSAPASGHLARIELEPGDPVEPGTVLARMVPAASPLLDPRSRSTAEARVAAAAAAEERAGAAVERAEAAARFAEVEARRFASLAEEGVIAARELEQVRLQERTAKAELASARFAHQAARHELQMARASLGRTGGPGGDGIAIRSPVAGRVLEVRVESEGTVSLGTPLVEVGDPDGLEIVVDVLTQEATEIAEGAPARIERWGGGPLKARVRRVEPSAFTRVSALGVEEQRVDVVLDLSEPAPGLGDGYRVEARIVVWSADDALSIPASAVFRDGDGWAVFRVENAKAKLTAIGVGRRTGRKVQIIEGLAPGDRVVLHPSDAVRDGVAVEER